MEKKRSHSGTILWGIGLFILFLIVLYAFNQFAHTVNNSYIMGIAQFLQKKYWLIIGTAALALVAHCLWYMKFPYNLPAPFFNATATVFGVTVAFSVIDALDEFLPFALGDALERYIPFVLFILFVLVLLGNLMAILIDVLRKNRVQEKTPSTPDTKITWEQLGEEFRQTLSDMLAAMRKAFTQEKSNSKKTKD